MPLRFRTAITTRLAMLPASSGSPGTSAQWSNTCEYRQYRDTK